MSVSLVSAERPAWDSGDGVGSSPCGRRGPILRRDVFPPWPEEDGWAARMVEAKDAAEAFGVNARLRLSNESPPDEEGGTARMVGLWLRGSS